MPKKDRKKSRKEAKSESETRSSSVDFEEWAQDLTVQWEEHLKKEKGRYKKVFLLFVFDF